MSVRDGVPVDEFLVANRPMKDALRRAEAAMGSPGLWGGMLLLLAALAIRAIQFGNPVIDFDEQFYLLVGDRILHGAVPFVDIWDRKPVGLYLIYSGARLLGGDGVIAYQLLATAVAAGTAWLIARIAGRIAPAPGGIVAGLIYLIFLSANGGDGGQAPVFYNALTALAGLGVVRVIERPHFDRWSFATGCAVMAILGVAIQVKYTVVFEGIFFGLALMITAYRKGCPPVLVLGATAIWVMLALLPTGTAFLWYWWHGDSDAFMFANFQSVFMRVSSTGDDLSRRVRRILVRTVPMALPAIAACLYARKARNENGTQDVQRFVTCWVIVALAAVIGFGTYHNHYALPLLLPLAIAGAHFYSRWFFTIRWPRSRRTLVIPVAALVALAGILLAWHDISRTRRYRGTAEPTYAAANFMKSRMKGCIFVFNGDPIFYQLTQSCLPTPFVFTTLLSETRDAETLGIDPMQELRRVMASHPQFVVTHDGFPFSEAKPDAWAYMKTVLDRDYRLVRRWHTGSKYRLIYQRRDDGSDPTGARH